MALDKATAKKYKWFQFEGEHPLEFGSNFNNPEYVLHIVKNNVVGIREYGGKYWLIHANSPDIVFRLKPHEYTRVFDNCKGWSGKIGRVKVEAGVGGKEKPVTPIVPPVVPEVKAPTMKDGKPKVKPKSGLLKIKNMDVSESSNLRKVEYDPLTKIMYVEFRSGAKWAYEPVSMKEYTEMDEALPVKIKDGDVSHGVYFHRFIRGKKNEYPVA